jgi:CBS domain-containing protein
MPKVTQILSAKGSQVLSVSPNATVLDAALLMNEHKIGALVVSEAGNVVGIFTERDVLRRVVAKRLDPANVRIADVMTREVVCCELDTEIEEAKAVFMNRRIRHLPVVDADGYLQGLISIGDLNAFQLDGHERTIHYLHEYLYGHA